MRTLLFALLAIVATHTVDAQTGSAYYGLALGSFEYEEGDGAGNDFISDSVSSYRLMVSYHFMEHLAVEGGWGETKTIRDSATLVFPGGDAVDFTFSSEFKILTLRILGVLPFDNGVSLVGGLGWADYEQDIDYTLGGIQASGEISDNEMAYYVGAQYDWDRLAIRLAYEKFDFSGDLDVAETTVTFFYKL
jgi:hypothetical protein